MRHRRRSNLPPFLALAALAAVAFSIFGRPSRQPEAAGGQPFPALPPESAGQPRQSDPSTPPSPFVRPAGPEAMRDPLPGWDAADEASDESFPASDPPARY